jgi:predicted DNA-binding antitoxin AbrB/MazE fold protein
MAVNQNTLARKITLEEGKKRQVSIAQVKEVLRIAIIRLANDYTEDDVLKLLARYRDRG